MLITDGNQLYEVLDGAECRRLLGDAGVGHLAFSQEALPAIQPVRYVVHDGGVAFRVRADSPMATLLHGSVVAFEVDSCDTGAWWSVTAVGHARVVDDPWDVAMLGALAGSRPADQDDRFVSVRLEVLRGWRMPTKTHLTSCAAG